MINFGPKAAQDDDDLLKYFHTTAQIEKAYVKNLESKGFIHVTRSGCGKTALVKWLNSNKLKREKVYLNPSKFSLVCDDETLSLENYKNIITAELYLGIVDEFKNKLDTELKKECNQLVKTNWLDKIGNFLKTSFSGISVLGNGFNLNPQERKEYLDFIKKTNKIEESGKLIQKISRKLSIIVIVDNPEYLVAKGLDEIDEDNSKRIGAFFSVLNNLNNKNIQVAAFTKEYIIQSVRKNYIDYGHFSDKIIGLEWDKSDLITMLENRITTKIKSNWDNIFGLSKKNFEENILPYLISGPRDLIDICNNAGKNGNKISKKMLTNEFERLRNDKWNEIDVQYKKQLKNILIFSKQVLEILINNKLDTFTKDKFESLIKKEFEDSKSALFMLRAKADWLYSAKWNLVNYLELFFLLGLFGYYNKSKKYYTWQGRSIDEFKKSSKYFISPLFIN